MLISFLKKKINKKLKQNSLVYHKCGIVIQLVDLRLSLDYVPVIVNNTTRYCKKINFQWHTGDICRAKYSEDGIYYEGTIIGMNAAAGVCTVRFVGYNNEEEMQLRVLLKSKGDAARRKQIELANDGLSEVRTWFR